LSRNVFDAYHFLIDNYESGDWLYLFGFSRGAFTARSLGGLIRNCGILRSENADRIHEAWSLYRSSADKPAGVKSTLFRRAYSYEPRIHFIGVWDTVGALGIPVPGPSWLKPIVTRLNHRWAFHDTKLSTQVNGAFHALAIDEQRAAFAPTLWHQQSGADGQELKQVWFTGVHCDIGGGYPDTSLSDIALLWMADRARECGLVLQADAFPASPENATQAPQDRMALRRSQPAGNAAPIPHGLLPPASATDPAARREGPRPRVRRRHRRRPAPSRPAVRTRRVDRISRCRRPVIPVAPARHRVLPAPPPRGANETGSTSPRSCGLKLVLED